VYHGTVMGEEPCTRAISVIVPVHNGASSIARTIESILTQRAPAGEIIVVDDGSTDDTCAIVAAYSDRVRCISIARRGPAAARNAGAAAAKGEMLAFLDADDQWRPDYLERMCDALASQPHAVLAFSEIIPIDETGAQVSHFVREGELRYAPTMDDLLTRWWPILTSAVVMRRQVFESCGGFAEEFTAPGYEDPWLWLRAREHGPFVFVADKLVLYTMIPEVRRMEKYMRGFKIFSRMAINRYGADGARLIANLRRAHASVLGYNGLLQLHLGDRTGARSSFALSLRYRPASSRTALRYLRTFLPYRIATALSGRTRRLSPAEARTAFAARLWLARE
jgi:glycosyltransferase involved in cell wall biosynthesis